MAILRGMRIARSILVPAAVPAALLLVAIAALAAPITPLFAAGPPFPAPVAGQRVYDPAGAIGSDTAAALARRIADIEQRTGAQVVVYLQVKPGISEDDNLSDARALMDQWGVGRKGFDDGLVILFGLDETLRHGRISLFGGAGFLNAYLSEDGLKEIIDQQMVPRARDGDIDGALINALDTLQARITPAGEQRLETYRQMNAVLGLLVAPLTLLGLLGAAFLAWRREGDDPEYLDSPSVLMAGPPADMTPPLATVVRNGRADQHSLDTTLMELASRGYLAFENLDQVGKVRSDSEPDPLIDPAIVVNPDPGDERPLAGPQQRALGIIRGQAAADNRLTRNSLWSLNDHLAVVKRILDGEALRLGWFSHLPGPAITYWTRIGAFEVVLGLV
ncbi:MAG TPA: TPM domain-containing protein, partial [Candidatus Limnocylindria bacterium]|nr:TPM domain-containing protein [Candidatus Limnocylindria bacterium]